MPRSPRGRDTRTHLKKMSPLREVDYGVGIPSAKTERDREGAPEKSDEANALSNLRHSHSHLHDYRIP
ncbi:hypothetical protein TNCV_3948621 [Trichonephila clavipes]|nr:hypothetical protein TNCV_3948621 [Trichonephila clavipes]